MWDVPFAHETQQVSIGGDVVESVVMHSDVRNVAGHLSNDASPSSFKKSIVTGRFELQQR
jgi:hypothetical protein